MEVDDSALRKRKISKLDKKIKDACILWPKYNPYSIKL